jgi:hypothetical protein
MHDGLFQGKSFRAFNVIDDFNREVLTIAIDTSLTSERVIREFDKLIEWRDKPSSQSKGEVITISFTTAIIVQFFPCHLTISPNGSSKPICLIAASLNMKQTLAHSPVSLAGMF